jgi:hypothetical protein
MSPIMISLSDIFTPNDTPTTTYVGREDLNLEERLSENCELPKMVVSISGPSKSGKTVLIKKVMDEDLIIPVIGSGIEGPEDLWNRALQWMGAAVSTTTVVSSGSSISGGVKGGGKVRIPFVAEGGGEAHADTGSTWDTSTAETTGGDGLTRVIKEIAGSDFVIFLDDFHYIDERYREEVGRQIKVASDNGVKIITASVPHRTDDVVRSNPELRGRVAALDVGYWEERHLKMIGHKGFRALNIELAHPVVSRLASEALGSPQLMQTICYSLCQVLGVTEPTSEHARVDVNDTHIIEALKRTSHFTDFSKMLSSLHSGPKTRGQERKEHDFVDGTKGDVYRAVLLAISADPITMSFTYDDLLARVKEVCTGDSPVGSSVTSCLEQMHSVSESFQPGSPVLAWDSNVLNITDPYFAFFLRSAEKLQKLGS